MVCEGWTRRSLAKATAPREATPERRVPPEAYILYAAGIQLQQQDKHAEAIARLEEALKLDPKSASILHGIGYAYYRLSKNDEAVDYLKRSLALDPENGPAHETLAFVHAAATRRDEALKELEAAARSKRRPSSLDPELPHPEAGDPCPAEEAEASEERGERAALAWDILAGLDPAERRLIALRTFEERSWKEIGAILSENPRTLRSRYSRLLARLRAERALEPSSPSPSEDRHV